MKKKTCAQCLCIVVLGLLLGREMHELYAGTKFLGEFYNSAYCDWDLTDTSLVYAPQSWHYTGTFENDPTLDGEDTIHMSAKKRSSVIGALGSQWSFQMGPRLKWLGGGSYSASGFTSSPLNYISGAIDHQAGSDINQKGQWGEGREIMQNYTHLGFFMYQQFENAKGGHHMQQHMLALYLIEDDLMDTYHDSYVNPVTGLDDPKFYWDIDDTSDAFPQGMMDGGQDDLDNDGRPDIQREAWMATFDYDYKNPIEQGGRWKGWKFVIFRLGRQGGEGKNDVNFYRDDPIGDFVRPPQGNPYASYDGDGRFNIREVRGGIGNPDVDLSIDRSDTFLINNPTQFDNGSSEQSYANNLFQHFRVRHEGAYYTTLPIEDYWVKGDVQGIKTIRFEVLGTTSTRGTVHTLFIDNIMFTTPFLGGGSVPLHVDYTWLSDNSNETLLSRPFNNAQGAWNDGLDATWKATPLETYEGFDMGTQYGTMWYEIKSVIPPTLNVKFGGGADLQRSTVHLYKYHHDIEPDGGPPLTGEQKAPLDIQLYSDGVDGFFIIPESALDYDQWYTMVVTPRGSDGDDQSASYGYAQVVNFRFVSSYEDDTTIDIIKTE